jgi:hypothetical protein
VRDGRRRLNGDRREQRKKGYESLGSKRAREREREGEGVRESSGRKRERDKREIERRVVVTGREKRESEWTGRERVWAGH